MGEIEGGCAEEEKRWEDSGGGKYSGDGGELIEVGVFFSDAWEGCMAFNGFRAV